MNAFVRVPELGGVSGVESEGMRSGGVGGWDDLQVKMEGEFLRGLR